MDIKKLIGERLKKERLRKNLNQPELAKKLNVAKGTVSNWENGNRSPDSEMLTKLAGFFNVSTDYLLGRTDDPNSKIIKTTINGNDYKMEVDKSYPYDLKPKEVEELIKQLETIGFDINKLITKIKNSDN